jgi:phosphoglycolate phosphatase
MMSGMDSVRHIVWDWNGTLLDDVTACVASVNDMLAPRGLPTISEAHYRDIFDFPVKRYYEQLGFDLEREVWDELAQEFHRHYARHARESQLHADVDELMPALSAAGYGMSVLSACEITLLERMLTEHGLRQYFEHVYGLDDLYASSKLAQGEALMAALQLPRDEVLLVGDTLHDRDVAAALGWSCALVAAGHQSEARLSAGGEGPSVIGHLGELTGLLGATSL